MTIPPVSVTQDPVAASLTLDEVDSSIALLSLAKKIQKEEVFSQKRKYNSKTAFEFSGSYEIKRILDNQSLPRSKCFEDSILQALYEFINFRKQNKIIY